MTTENMTAVVCPVCKGHVAVNGTDSPRKVSAKRTAHIENDCPGKQS